MSHGYATYPGVISCLSASYTITHGITPGVISMTIAPQVTDIAAIGNVVFYYGNQTLTLLDCKADQASTVRGSNGTITSLSILDRRWRWRYGEMYGHYNQRDESGDLITETERTPQQLAVLLLNAMGEACDVSAIPNSTREEYEWVGENPAAELADMLERLGCSIVLRPDSSIAIVRLGSGVGLPINEFLEEQQVAANPPEVPALIRVVCAPVRHQARLDLEAVGEDVDGRLRPIDSLSYKPQVSAGWGGEYTFFSQLTDNQTRALALKTVYRYYRIRDRNSLVPKDVVNSPLAGPVSTLRQILPLSHGLVTTGVDLEGKAYRRKERVFGIYFIRNVASPVNSSETAQYEYTGDYQIDYDHGIVIFRDSMVRWNSTSKLWEPAQLKLECSFYIMDRTLGSQYRYFYTLPTNANAGSGVDVVRRDDINREIYEVYSESGTTGSVSIPQGWNDKTPIAEIDAAAAVIAQGRRDSYLTELGATGHYAGLHAFAPDGAIQQVTWEIGPGGTHTTVSRLAEVAPYVPTTKQRRIQQMQRQQRWAAQNRAKGGNQ